MDDEILDIVGDIYDCAIEPDRWPPTLKRVVDCVNADCAWLNFYDLQKPHLGWGAAWGIGPEVVRSYSDRLHAVNPMLSAGWFADIGEPYTAQGLMGDEFVSTRFYKEWVAPNGWHDAAITTLTKTPTRVSALTLPRRAARAQFTPHDLGRVRLFAPHMSRSVTIAYMLDDRALRDNMLSATLDLLVVGIVLVDAEARIVHANRAGARHLDEAQAVRRSDDHLSARDPAAAAALRDAVAKATQAGAALQLTKTGIAVPIAGADGDLTAWVLPLDSGLRNELRFRVLGESRCLPERAREYRAASGRAVRAPLRHHACRMPRLDDARSGHEPARDGRCSGVLGGDGQNPHAAAFHQDRHQRPARPDAPRHVGSGASVDIAGSMRLATDSTEPPLQKVCA